MLIFTDFLEVNFRCEGRHKKMHVGCRLTCCNFESIEVLC